MIEDEKVVIIVSAGRTGTKYFGNVLKDVLDDCFSIHEPDILNHGLKDTFTKIAKFGLYNMVIGRLFGSTGIRVLSEKRLSKQLSETEIKKRLLKLRQNYYGSFSEKLIVESYYAWYALIDLFLDVFPNSKAVGVIRDPRDWVRSNMNWGTQYGHRDTVTKFGFSRLNPKDTGDESAGLIVWDKADLFEKLCWEWKVINESIYTNINKDSFQLYRYEDLFLNDSNNTAIEMLEFIRTWEDHEFNYHPDKLNLRKVIHKNLSYDFSKWSEWSTDQAKTLHKYCGPLMEKMDYGNESEWKELLA